MKKITLSLFLFLAISLTSCFEVIEEVSLNETGGGVFKLTLNLSKSKGEVKKLLALDTLRGAHVPSIEEISHEIDLIVRDLKQIKGVTNVVSNKNFEEFILSIEYQFVDVSTLNHSIREIIKKRAIQEEVDIDQLVFFTYTNNTFERDSSFDFKIIMKNLDADITILETSTYTSIYRFPAPVIASENGRAKVSKSGKAVLNKVSAARLIRKHTLIHNKITHQ